MAQYYGKVGDKFGTVGGKIGIVTIITEEDTLLNGLVAYWKLDETDGSVYDSTDNNNDAVVTGADYYATGKISRCLEFNGTASDYVTVAHSTSLNISGTISFAAWVRTTNTFGTIISKAYDAEVPFQWCFVENDWPNVIQQIAVNYGSTYYRVNSSIGFWDEQEASEWAHLVCTLNASDNEVYFYVNGVQDAKQTGITQIPTNTEVVHIGQLAVAGNYMPGRIDELGIWNRILTPTEASTLFNNGTGKTYPFT